MFGNEIIVGEVWWQNRWEIFAGNFSFCSPFIEYFYLWGVSMANRKTFKTREFSVEMRIYWCMVIQFGRVLCFFLDLADNLEIFSTKREAKRQTECLWYYTNCLKRFETYQIDILSTGAHAANWRIWKITLQDPLLRLAFVYEFTWFSFQLHPRTLLFVNFHIRFVNNTYIIVH